MDSSKFAVDHALSVSSLTIRHSFDIPARAETIARELRITVLGVAAAYVACKIVTSYLDYSKAVRARN